MQNYDLMFKEFTVFLQLLQELMFGIDIIISFFCEFKDKETGDYIREPKRIALNYLKTTFWIDFLAFFPFFEVFGKWFKQEEKDGSYDFYHLICLLRLLRMYKAAELLKPNYIFRGVKQLHKLITGKIQ